jgi:hypothetical protein
LQIGKKNITRHALAKLNQNSNTAKNLKNHQKEKEERNEPRTKYLNARITCKSY